MHIVISLESSTVKRKVCITWQDIAADGLISCSVMIHKLVHNYYDVGRDGPWLPVQYCSHLAGTQTYNTEIKTDRDMFKQAQKCIG